MTVSAPPSRNAPCPCGSGRRYKDCHGALAPARGAETALSELLAAALSAQKRGELAAAADLYTRALALDPANFDALHMLGVTQLLRNDYARARELLVAARTLRPDVAAVAHNLELVDGALRHAAATAAYRRWIATTEKALIAARAPLRDAIVRRADAPRLSLLVPAYNSPPRWLGACLDSVLAQSYPHWELCIADDASTDAASRATLARYAERDPRIRVDWRSANGHISAASNSALALASAPYVALLDHDDALPPHALAEVALALAERSDAAILYTDEDKVDEDDARFEPYFKPEWNPALATSQNFVSHLGVYRTDLVRAVGGFREGFEGAQDWDLLLRCAERVAATRIVHVPQVLYHWRSIAGSTARGMASKDYASAAQERTVREHARRCGADVSLARVVYRAFLQADPVVPALPAITIIVLHAPSLPAAVAVGRWTRRREMAGAEIVPVAVPGEDGDEIDDAPLRLGRDGAAAINAASAAARGDLLVFVAAATVPADEGWLVRLAGHALQPEVGCAGGVTFDAAQRTARGGYVLDADAVALTAFAREPRGFPGMAGRNLVVQNLSALSLAGLAVRRAAWEAVEGLDVVDLASAYHDVDFCLRLAERGLRHVWHPGVVFVDERRLRARSETIVGTTVDDAAYMRVRHAAVLARDPAYNPHLSRRPPLFEFPDPEAADRTSGPSDA